MAKLFLCVLKILLIARVTKACILKAKIPSAKELKLHGPWSDAQIKRNFSSCECGQKILPGEIPPWHLYIHVGVNICSGTIVTSNLIATSHECVRLPNKGLTIFDAWNISTDYNAFEKVKDIRVTSSGDQDAGETFPVLHLIPTPKFLLSWKTKSEILGYDSLDLLLIKVRADFTSHKQHSPICILQDSNDLDFVERTGYHNTNYGLSASRNTSHETYEGIIFTRKMCQGAGVDKDIYLSQPGDRVKHDELAGLCFRWFKPAGYQPPIGGALFLKSGSEHSFLAGVGMASTTTTEMIESDSFVGYSLFSNIIPMIKYLEYRAHQHHSIWCKAPPINLEDKRPYVNGRRWVWPWESKSFQETFKGRNESLDCVCGVPNQKPSRRNVGGVLATPHEFGWMVLLNMYNNGREDKMRAICGAAIINDRMILTAAHCLVPEDKIKTGQPIKLEALDVIVKINFRRQCRPDVRVVERVIVHPDYVGARTKNYVDYDVALIVLKDKLDFPPLPEEPEDQPTPNLRPICLPKMGETIQLIGEHATVAGWGRTDPDDPKSIANYLRKLDVPIKPLQNCKSIATLPVADRFLCAGTQEKFRDVSNGDSGSPLSIFRGRQWMEVGIASWVQPEPGDNPKKTASLYTSVSHPDILSFIDYFANQVGVNWCKSEIAV